MTRKTLLEIARDIEGEIIGNADQLITGVSGIKDASEGDISFLANPIYLPLLEKTRASAVITSREISASGVTIVRTENPLLAFTKVISLFTPVEAVRSKGVHTTVVLGNNVSLGKDVAIGAYAVIEDGTVIGSRSVVLSGSFVGRDTSIGEDALIYPNVTIRERTLIGHRVIIHSGTVIGSDGFGFIAIKGVHTKIPQVGIVEIGDDVEIGANVAIDRACFDKTIIGKGTKIDNLVQIAHNVVIGENSIIVAQAGISGSTVIGNNVTLAGQAGLVGHISVGDGAIVAAQAGVTKSVPANALVSGYPARNHAVAKRVNACVQNLPKLYVTINALKKKVEELEAKVQNK